MSIMLGIITASFVYVAFLPQIAATGTPVFVIMIGALTCFVGILVGTAEIIGRNRLNRKDWALLLGSVLVLGVVVSLPFAVVKWIPNAGGSWYFLEVLLAVFLPSSAIVAGVYGWLRMQPQIAFLLGALPYASFVFVEPRLAGFLVIPGIPFGFLGAAPALFRIGLARQADLASVVGFVLLLVGLLFWLFFVGAVSNG